jgi:hypothetical protein
MLILNRSTVAFCLVVTPWTDLPVFKNITKVFGAYFTVRIKVLSVSCDTSLPLSLCTPTTSLVSKISKSPPVLLSVACLKYNNPA